MRVVLQPPYIYQDEAGVLKVPWFYTTREVLKSQFLDECRRCLSYLLTGDSYSDLPSEGNLIMEEVTAALNFTSNSC